MKNYKENSRRQRTELIFILDRSGSMAGLERDTIGGYNALIAQQKREAGECNLTTVLFDNRYELLHDRVPLKHVHPMTEREYSVRGSTALLDALGCSIERTVQAQRYALPEKRADKVMFVITTDGMENASREYTLQQIRQMVEYEKARYGWEFIFLGANIDAVGTAAQFGINADRAANYHADGEGTRINFEVLSEAVSRVRASQPMQADWKARIDRDCRERG